MSPGVPRTGGRSAAFLNGQIKPIPTATEVSRTRREASGGGGHDPGLGPCESSGERQDGGGARARNQVPGHQGSGGSSGPGPAAAERAGAHGGSGWGSGAGSDGKGRGFAEEGRRGSPAVATRGAGRRARGGVRGRGPRGRRVGFCPGQDDAAEGDGCAGCGAVTGLRKERLGLSLHGEGGLVTVPGGGPGVSVSGEAGRQSRRRGAGALSPAQGGGAARGPCPGRVLVALPPQEGAGRVSWRARSPPVLRPRPGRLRPPSAPAGSQRLRPLPGVGSFAPTLCREGKGKAAVGQASSLIP